MSPISPDELHKIFKNLDKSNKGVVTILQLHHLLFQIGVHRTTSLEEVERLVGQPTLDYFEFMFFYEAMIKSAETTTTAATQGQDRDSYEHDLAQAFKVFDLNGDGYISPEELQSVLLRLGLLDRATGQDCRDMIRVYDENCDGFLDFEEFKNMMRANS